MAAVLSMRERSRDSKQSFIPSLIDALRSKELLLVLDNCEHLVVACAHLAEVLSVLVRGCEFLPPAERPWASGVKHPGRAGIEPASPAA